MDCLLSPPAPPAVVLWLSALPADEASFFEVMRTYFPSFYDIKVHPYSPSLPVCLSYAAICLSVCLMCWWVMHGWVVMQYLMTACQNLHGGLQKVSEDLKVRRIGPMHQAGSDSLLTAQTFFKVRHPHQQAPPP